MMNDSNDMVMPNFTNSLRGLLEKEIMVLKARLISFAKL
jgi:hypothetical protein